MLPGVRTVASRAVSAGQPRPVALAGAELREWMALRRVCEGAVTKLVAHWLDHGRPVPCYLPDVLDDLTCGGLIALADPDPMLSGMRRAIITPAGRTRYLQLCAKRCPDSESPRRKRTDNDAFEPCPEV